MFSCNAWLLRQSFEFFAFSDRVILGKLLKAFDGKIEIDLMLRNQPTIKSIFIIK